MEHHASIRFPARKRYLELALGFVEEFSRAQGMTEELLSIRLGLEEALVNVIDHGRPEDDMVELNAQADSLGVEFVILERGVPFDTEALEHQLENQGTDVPERGLGLRLMQTFMDGVSFASLGRKGKETRLSKRFITPPPGDFHDEAGIEEGNQVPEDVSYTVRPMRPEEAVDVARCAYSAYGYSFILDSAYDAKAIRELNGQGILLSMVAVTDDGEIMGHASMAFDDDPKCGAWGRAFVRKRFRRLGCLNEISRLLLEEAYKRELQWAVADAVSSHPYSQRAAMKYGFEACCLVLARTTPLDIKAIAEARQRESILLCFRRIVPLDEQVPLYPPARHKEMIATLYQGLGEHPELLPPKQTDLPDQSHVMEVVTDSLPTVTIIMGQYGKDVLADVRQTLRGACRDEFKAIYLLLDLADPLTAVLTPEFETMGFFFGGVRPRSDGRDQLVMQYLNNVDVDFGAMQLASEQAERLKDYVQTEFAKSNEA